VVGWQGQCLLVVLRADDAQHRPEDLIGVDGHIRGDVVEQGGADEKATLKTLISEGQIMAGLLAAVDHDLGPGLYARVDIAANPLERGLGDKRTIVSLRIEAVSDSQVVDPLNEPGAQPICRLLTDWNRDTDRHAALARAAVSGSDQRIDGLIEVGVRHDDHVVLCAAEAL